ncbi:MAG: oxidoreductase [Chromatiaceae bacterium]|nr:MAG: oxidoreductase [Chromatiaceae bacterium]
MIPNLASPGWAVALIFIPLLGAMLAFLLPRIGVTLGLLAAVLTAGSVLPLLPMLAAHGATNIRIGGWGAPLGIELSIDGLTMAMLAMTALVGIAVSAYATCYLRPVPSRPDGQPDLQQRHFWPLWLVLWAALNALFLSSDIFNLYVTLELLGLAAVALTALSGGADALNGAMRYLLVSLLGSLGYLLGVALLYHAYGTLDLGLLALRVGDETVTRAALGAMTAGLLVKTALFPLHFWLPPAHASASAPVSALLSALVVKASFYLLLRLWLTLFGDLDSGLATLLGVLGAIAILWGSIQALRQARLKLLIAYSTVAQIGYLFLAFPLAATGGAVVWGAAVYLVLSHALAKAAMFLTAGSLLRFGAHDRIADLDRVVHRLPITIGAFTLAGVSIMGLPPSGGFIGKWLLLQAAFSQGRWGLALVMLAGGLLAAAYVFKVIGYAFTPAVVPHQAGLVPPTMEWTALALGAGAILLGFAWPLLWPLLEIGMPFGALAPDPGAAVGPWLGGPRILAP